MDKRTLKYFRLFRMRFRKNYFYFLSNYSGKNIRLYMDQFTHDHIKLARQLFGEEGAVQMKDYIRKLSVF